jgi:hypothetical protein
LAQAGTPGWPVLTAHAKAPLTLGQGHRAKDASGDQTTRLTVARMLAQMVPNAQLHPVGAAAAHHGHGVVQGGGHGFFGEDVLPGLCCLHRVVGVQGIGRGNEHRLNAGVPQERVQVAVGGPGFVLLGKGRGALLVAAIHCHQFGVWRGVNRWGDLVIRMQSSADDGPTKRHWHPSRRDDFHLRETA